DWAYACDKNWDAFHSNIAAGRDGIKISDTEGVDKFSIEARWNVEGFGYIFITADNGGEFYSLPASGKTAELNLVYELAKSRIFRNRRRMNKHKTAGYVPGTEVSSLIDLSEELFHDAEKTGDEYRKSGYAQSALLYAMTASEKLELENAMQQIKKRGARKDFYFGCDARGFNQMDPDIFLDNFSEAFNYATITHYLTHNGYQDFEPQEENKKFNLRSIMLDELRARNITVEGRPLFYFYETVTPDWLRKKSYSELLKYVESHTREVVGHYGDKMYAWEIINEAHDWANELQLSPDQITEVAKLACDVSKDTNPKVHRLINNCCPFAEYVQLKKWGKLDAKYPQRTPIKFMQDLAAAGVDFTITGGQMYFPYRDLQDIIINIERFEQFGKPHQLTEVGASSGPTKDSINTGRLEIEREPYIWRRPWDMELQADWLEGIYTLAYSKPWIEAVNWYDFVDPFSWIKNGGLHESARGEKKAAFDRLINLRKQFESL
ncbi:MAG TPA: endo-1,4-beta-xylanase, partial [Ignavibacteriales bacterium]|nr:endo-1,4-beta-xylanase [Ignavibacteriales bacterium]